MVQKDTSTPTFIAALFTKPRHGSNLNRCINKEDVVNAYNGILLNHKKNGIMSFATTWMELAIVILSEVKSDRERQYHILLIC